ncbi:hypothetical protein GYA27_03395 [candidate division WWE3 bacterium]|uniref:Camelysin metallo-endopeptidase n=1 Tax=candidate division WWE3 bacterium TaxID=2053526 RepID=A0A7X9DKT1_UNCKA|nr:hypothetical protein [candidate division WWE3 bacterium]
MKKSNYIKKGLLIAILITVTAGLTYAAFGDKGKVLGSKFSVGSADIKLLLDTDVGTVPENLVEEMPGPQFDNVVPNWSEDYEIKIFNNGSTPVTLTSNADYLTANDPDELRSIIYVEPIIWNDIDTNGIVDSGEEGESLGRKTIVKWKTEGYQIGEVASGAVKSLILRFSTDAVSDTKQGKSAIFDFSFDSLGM